MIRVYTKHQSFTIASDMICRMVALEMNCECCLCKAAMPSKQSTSLLSPIRLLQKCASRIQNLCDVHCMHIHQQWSSFVHWLKCKQRLAFLEKSAMNCEDFREQARKCLTVLLSRGRHKRPKDTCESTVPPDPSQEKYAGMKTSLWTNLNHWQSLVGNHTITSLPSYRHLMDVLCCGSSFNSHFTSQQRL